MLAFLALFSLSADIFGDLSIVVTHGKDQIVRQTVFPGKSFDFGITENETLSLSLRTTLKSAPKHHVVSLEHGMHTIAATMQWKNGNLEASFTPTKLKKLFKHSEDYSLNMFVADPSLGKPFSWTVGIVAFTANNEVVDNFTDVEWDFQPPHPTPSPFLTHIFNLLMLGPFGILIILLLVNGINFGYFPHNFIDAIFSMAFVACLGAFFYYFIVFWKSIHFEDMMRSLIPIVLVLGFLLRRALIGRAKMVARYAKTQAKTE